MESAPQCPFVYANGRRCTGTVYKARAYGAKRRDGEVESFRKVRVWCTEKDDHAGAGKDFQAKERMEFYPDKLPDELNAYLRAQGEFDR